jgi:hypothetical protein
VATRSAVAAYSRNEPEDAARLLDQLDRHAVAIAELAGTVDRLERRVAQLAETMGWFDEKLERAVEDVERLEAIAGEFMT